MRIARGQVVLVRTADAQFHAVAYKSFSTERSAFYPLKMATQVETENGVEWVPGMGVAVKREDVKIEPLYQ